MITALIPARRGSTRVTNKNLSVINGRNLIQRAIDFATGVGIEKVIVFTDYTASEVGCNPKYVVDRNPSNAATNSLADDYLREILPKLDSETIVLLQPTSPFRSSNFFKVLLERYVEIGCDDAVVASGTIFRESLWQKNHHDTYVRVDEGPRSQLLRKQLMVEDGAFYLFDRLAYLRAGSLDSLKWEFVEHEWPYNLDINNASDLRAAILVSEHYD